jgi:hypothetical protein
MKGYSKVLAQIGFVLTGTCALLLPWNFLVPQLATFLFFFWLIGGNWKEKWHNIKSSPLIVFWMAFWAINLLGRYWSTNTKEAEIALVTKLGLLVFPLVFSSSRYSEKQTKMVFGLFLAGLSTVGIFMIARAVFLYENEGVSHFSYQDFSEHIMHQSYLSLYYVVGVMLLFHGVLLQYASVRNKAYASVAILFFCILVFMLASKTGIVSLILVFLFYIGYAIVRFKRYVVAAAALIILFGGFFVALRVFPALDARLHAMTEALSSTNPVNPAETESNRVRLLIWQADMELISAHPLLGTGTGDVQDDLMLKYSEKGMTGAYEKKFNAHSQFFQTGIALGLLGMGLLVAIFLSAFVWSIRKRYGFIVLFTSILVFNFIPESMLQLQAGTLFVGFFYSLVLFAADHRVLSPPDGDQ